MRGVLPWQSLHLAGGFVAVFDAGRSVGGGGGIHTTGFPERRDGPGAGGGGGGPDREHERAGCDSVITTNIGVLNIDNSVSQSGGTLTANDPFASYQWVDCANGFTPLPGDTNQSFTPTQTSQYAVVLSFMNCTDTSSCIPVTVTGTAGPDATGTTLYPNPSTGTFIITGITADPGEIEVTDLHGRRLEFDSELVNQGRVKVNLGPVAEGMYFVRIRTGEGWTALRVWVAWN